MYMMEVCQDVYRLEEICELIEYFKVENIFIMLLI